MALTENMVNEALVEKSLKMACKVAFNLKNGLNATKKHKADLYLAVVELGKPWPKGWKVPKLKLPAASLETSKAAAATPSPRIFCPGCGAMINYTEPKGSILCIKCGKAVNYRVLIKRTIEISLAD